MFEDEERFEVYKNSDFCQKSEFCGITAHSGPGCEALAPWQRPAAGPDVELGVVRRLRAGLWVHPWPKLEPSLLEVTVKGKRLQELHLPHDRETGAIGKGPYLVVIVPEQLPGFSPCAGVNPHELDLAAILNRITKG